MTRAEAARAAAARLAQAGIDDPERDTRRLLRWATGLTAAALSAAMAEAMRGEEPARFEQAVARRAAREPLSHITGEREFWGRSFAIGPEALDPRPDTETLVAWALEGPAPARIVDLGVGSGCILLTLLAEWPQATGLGVDASKAALALARRNADRVGVADRAALRRGDWLCGVDGPVDLVAANPPYLDAAEMTALQPELRFEPALALDGGVDGLAPYRAILRDLPRVLAPDGAAYFEIAAARAEQTAALIAEAGLRPTLRHDLAGRPRVLRATF